jgi:hypothetical protein
MIKSFTKKIKIMDNYKDYRIGNLVKFKDEPMQIETLCSSNYRTDITLKHLSDSLSKNKMYTTMQKIESINLDSQTLKKLNFEKFFMNNWISYQINTAKSFYIKENKNGFYLCTNSDIKMRNVHELQNLFYLQTKNELSTSSLLEASQILTKINSLLSVSLTHP